MNVLTCLLHDSVAHRVGWVLLHSLWQGALVGVVFGMVSHALLRRSANARYLAGCLALLLLAAGPVLTLVMLPAPLSRPEASPLGSAWQGSGLPRFGEAGGANSPWTRATFSLVREGAGVCGQVASPLALVWLAGVVCCLARLAGNCWWVRRLQTRGCPWEEPAWLEILDDLRCRLGISRPVRLLKSALVEVPTVVGWIRPVILLPAATLAGLTPEQLEAVLAHELAHVRRFDYLVNVCQCALETLMFYHPVVWWVSRCVREERENCCDDLVLRVCEDRLVYARALAALEESRQQSFDLAFAAGGAPLLNRIRRLLGVSAGSGRPVGRQLGGLALLGAGLALILAGVFLIVRSPSSQGEAICRIRLVPGAALTALPRDGRQVEAYDPYFIQTEFEVLDSSQVLGRVVEKLNLMKEWGRRYAGGKPLDIEQAVAMLKSHLTLKPVRNTTLIEIHANSDTPKEAADIANALSQAYRDYRLDQLQKPKAAGLDAMIQMRDQKTQETAALGEQVERLRKEINFPDALAGDDSAQGADGPRPFLSAETLRRVNGLVIESEAEYVRQATLLKRLKALLPETCVQALVQGSHGHDSALSNGVQVLSAIAPDPLLTSQLEALTMAEQRLLLAQADWGSYQPEVVKARLQVEDLREKVQRRAQGVMEGLEARVDSLGQGLTNLLNQIEEAKQQDLENANRCRPYYDARRRLVAAQAFLRLLDTKIASERIGMDLSGNNGVEVVDAAVPPLRLGGPNRHLPNALIALGVLLDLLGAMLLTASRPSPSR